MKAIVYTKYGSPDVLQFKEVAKPTPKDHEVLVKVHATSLNAAESHIIRGTPFLARLMIGGIFSPKHTIPGADIAGRVEAVGKNVKQFKVGDEVFGDLSESQWGAFAEYTCADEKALVLKPTNVSFEAAASVPLAGVTALQGLQKGKIAAGQKVLVNGASGGVGSFAVQIAKSFGAEVTGVCSTRKVAMVRALGADHILDYTRVDITHSTQQYDLILDTAAQRHFLEYKRILTPKGSYVMAGGAFGQILRVMIFGSRASRADGQQFSNLMAKPNADDLRFIGELMAAGKVNPAIDRCFPLSETAEALRYFEAGQVQGKTVITVV